MNVSVKVVCGKHSNYCSTTHLTCIKLQCLLVGKTIPKSLGGNAHHAYFTLYLVNIYYLKP